jgi:type II secretory pathway component PulM
MIKAYWNHLEIRQKRTAAAGAVLLVMALLLEFVVFPLWDHRAKMRKSIAANTRILQEIKKLDADFAVQNAQISKIKQAMNMRRADFSLFSHLERKAQAAGVKGHLKQMNAVLGAKTTSFEESLVDLKLEKITIRQLADFLYQVESPSDMIRIKRITIVKMKESPDYISAQMLIASLSPSASSPGGTQRP